MNLLTLLVYLVVAAICVVIIVLRARPRKPATSTAAGPVQQMPLYTLATMPDGTQQMVPVPAQMASTAVDSDARNGIGILSLLVGVVSVAALVIGEVILRTVDNSFSDATALTWVSLVAGVIGLILGIVAITMCRQHRANNLPVAIVGLCLSSIILVIFLVALVFLGSLLG